jgi:hypothetical protein
MSEPTKVAIAGDWHGNGGWAEQVIYRAHEEGADAMIQVGDFGFWTPGISSEMYLDRVSDAVSDTGIVFHWLPGNHEYWPGLPGDAGRGTRPSLVNGNLIYLPIGYRWEWWGKKFMAVGGAFSIDRFMRSEGRSYWNEELLTDEDVTWCTHQPHGVDVMFAHDCPRGVSIPGIGPDSKPRGGASLWPDDMLHGAQQHRIKLREIWDAHKPQRFYHGHYHVDHLTYFGPTIFRGLDMDGTSYHGNVTYLTPADLE